MAKHFPISSSARGGLEPAFRVLFSAVFHGVALNKRWSGRKHWKAVEAKLLQTAASLRTFFVLVISAEADFPLFTVRRILALCCGRGFQANGEKILQTPLNVGRPRFPPR